MKILGLAFLLAAVTGTALFLVLWGVGGLDEHVAIEVGSIPVLAVPHIADALEKWDAKSAFDSGHKVTIHAIDGYSISLPIVIVAAAAIFVAITQISSVIPAFIMSFSMQMASPGDHEMTQSFASAIGILSLPLQLTGAFFLGRWIGGRCSGHLFGALALSSAIGAVGSRLLDYWLVPADDLRRIFGGSYSVSGLLLSALISFVVFFIPGLLGVWRGRKRRLSNYMRYLLFVLPIDTQNLLVDLAFEEAKKSVASRGSLAHKNATS